MVDGNQLIYVTKPVGPTVFTFAWMSIKYCSKDDLTSSSDG